MSKSYDNAIYLSESPEDIRKKVGRYITDPARMRKSDPGNPDVCNVFDYHNLYSNPETVADVDHQCRAAARGCVECKKILADHLVAYLKPIREKRKYYEERMGQVEEIITSGSDQARGVAEQTMAEVRAALKM
jgi:tryptophanyl-tRNA synthetase